MYLPRFALGGAAIRGQPTAGERGSRSLPGAQPASCTASCATNNRLKRRHDIGRKILSQITRGDFDDLFERATNQALRILRDRVRAEEVAADAVGRVVMGGKDRKNLKLIVHGLAVDAYRRLQREQPWDMNELGENEDEYDILLQQQPLTFEQVEFRADFDRALRALPVELDRQAFLLTTVRGLSYREAAEVLDIDHTSVYRHAERARAQIKEALA